ncbi:MAG: GAF domain-containing protein [Bacteroidetes bacterium]|nr:GAF domain-containing protein [Bacteroidota bacterium]
MLKSKVQYIMTWVSLGSFLSCGLGLMVLSWNGAVSGSPSPSIMILLWIAMTASGFYLFMLAVKKAHRLWIQDERQKKQAENLEGELPTSVKGSSRKNKKLDIPSTTRKLVRRIPEDQSLKQSAQELLKSLARELEIMSGVVYTREKRSFRSVATYAQISSTEPYSFTEGEGLTGQVAANQQIMVLTRLPKEYLEVYSGLGKSEPAYLAIVPLVHQNRTIAVLECSGYRYDPSDIEALFRIFARDLMVKLSPNIK